MRNRTITPVLCAAVFGLLAATCAHAVDQGITGKKLLLKKTPKLVLLSKDLTISIAGSDPTGGSDSSITFDEGFGAITFLLPAANWSANSSGTVFTYKNTSAPSGPSPVKLVKVKAGLVKVVASGLPYPVPATEVTMNVTFSLAGGANTYCMAFTGAGNGNKFLVKDTAAATCGVGPGVCGNDLREGAEACDGIADAACPGDCLSACTCAMLCPASGGDTTACNAFFGLPSCYTCCSNDNDCGINCFVAATTSGCEDTTLTDLCAASVNAAGCAAECCP